MQSTGRRAAALLAGALSCMAIVGGTPDATAQESIRMSLTGSEAAEARRKARTSIGYYNLNLGPTWWRFGAGLGTEFNDNVRYASDKESDFIIRPSASFDFLWPVTEQNSLNLRVDGGYAAYVDHSELSRWFIRPGSELAFDVYVGKVMLNLHDRFTIMQDTYMDPNAYGYGDVSRLENVAGIGALWDLNKLVFRGGYDHANYITISGDDAGQQPDGQNEILFTSLGYELQRQMMAGVEAGFGFVNYDESRYIIFTEAIQWNVGVFFEAPLTEYMKLELGGGWTSFDPEVKANVDVSDTLDGFYGRAILRHRLNQYVDYSLSAGRNISFTFYGGTMDLYYARLQANWHLLQKITLGTSFDYDGGTQYDYGKDEFDRFGGGISLSRAITEKLGASVAYRIYVRDSSQSRDYTVNMATLDLRYRF